MNWKMYGHWNKFNQGFVTKVPETWDSWSVTFGGPVQKFVNEIPDASGSKSKTFGRTRLGYLKYSKYLLDTEISSSIKIG